MKLIDREKKWWSTSSGGIGDVRFDTYILRNPGGTFLEYYTDLVSLPKETFDRSTRWLHEMMLEIFQARKLRQNK